MDFVYCWCIVIKLAALQQLLSLLFCCPKGFERKAEFIIIIIIKHILTGYFFQKIHSAINKGPAFERKG